MLYVTNWPLHCIFINTIPFHFCCQFQMPFDGVEILILQILHVTNLSINQLNDGFGLMSTKDFLTILVEYILTLLTKCYTFRVQERRIMLISFIFHIGNTILRSLFTTEFWFEFVKRRMVVNIILSLGHFFQKYGNLRFLLMW